MTSSSPTFCHSRCSSLVIWLDRRGHRRCLRRARLLALRAALRRARGLPRRVLAGLRAGPFAEDRGELSGGEPLELPLLGPAAVEHRDLEVLGGDHPWAALPLPERLDCEPDRVLEARALLVALAHVAAHGLRVAPH